MADYKLEKSKTLPSFKQPKSPKLKFAKLAKSTALISKKKKMDQFFGPKTTSMSAMEGRLKVAATKRKIAKASVKKAKKGKTGMKASIPMM